VTRLEKVVAVAAAFVGGIIGCFITLYSMNK
jgi:uncharacterized protein YqgC (DUF456 family)